MIVSLVATDGLADTFGFETATGTGTKTVTETVSGVTLTVTDPDANLTITAGGGYAGTSGNVLVNPNLNTTSQTFSFSSAVTITSIRLADQGAANNDITLTPSSGTPIDVTLTTGGTTEMPVDWVGITQFVVTETAGDGFVNDVVYDNIVFTVAASNSAPTAGTVTANNVTQANAGGTTYTFTIAYSDSDGNFDPSTIDTSDVTVTGGATVSNASFSGNAAGGTATYTVTPPGGSWDDGDNGTYTIAIVANQIGDTTPAYVAANASAGSFTVSMDTTSPPAPSTPDLSASSDSGSSSTDNITSDTTPTLTGTSEANATVMVSSSVNGAVGSTSADGAGNWTLTTSTLSQGAHNLTATATDAAMNTSSASAALAVTIDTAPPTAPSAPDMTSATDSGTSNSDNLTNDTTPTFTGTAEANSSVTLISSVDGNVGTSTADGAGNWSITSSALSEGGHNLTATATDTAGNTSLASSALAITIDTTAPSAPGTPDMTAATDSGSSNTDNVTNDSTPDFIGTSEPNSTVALISSVDGNVGSATADGSGNWSITSATLSEGAHDMTATATDAAGNVSSLSASLAITINLTPPAVPGTPDLEAASDLGSSDSDDLTSDNTPTFSGTSDANVTINLMSSVDGAIGSASADGSGNWSITASALSEGMHDITAVAENPAGGTSGASSALSVTIDVTAPAAPSTPDMTAGTDTGSSNSDNVTSNTTPTFTGTAESGSTVTLSSSVDGNIGTATADGGGNWSITASTLSPGTATVTATATDTAGNTSPGSSGLAIEILSDNDGVPGTTEDQVPDADGSGNGDGNGDGMPDSAQADVVSVQTGAGGGWATIANDGAFTIENVSVGTQPGDAPPGVVFPFGVLNFTISGIAPGATVNLSVFVDYDPTIVDYMKRNRNTNNWDYLGATVSQIGTAKTRLDFQLTDGGDYDTDGLPNGSLVDPGGPVQVNAINVTPVPALGGFGLGLLGLLFGLFGHRHLRTRRLAMT